VLYSQRHQPGSHSATCKHPARVTAVLVLPRFGHRGRSNFSTVPEPRGTIGRMTCRAGLSFPSYRVIFARGGKSENTIALLARRILLLRERAGIFRSKNPSWADLEWDIRSPISPWDSRNQSAGRAFSDSP